MTPKDKAKNLVEKMYIVHSHSASDITYYFVKECALIAVDEILEMIDEDEIDVWNRDILIYWKEVKKEIEKL